MIYSIVVFFIFLGIIRFDICRYKRGRNNYYWFIIIILIFLSGFAYRLGGDGYVYYREYENYVDIFHFNENYYNRYSNIRLPGWMILSSITKSIIHDYWFFKLIHAFIVNGLFAYGLFKCTKYIYTALLFYFVLVYFNFNFQVLRESLAISIFMYSLPFFFTKKWFKYYLCCLLSLTFHESCIFTFTLPLFSLWDKSKRIKLIYFFILVIMLLSANNIRGYLFHITPELGVLTDRFSTYSQVFNEDYTFSSFWNFVLNVVIPLFIVYYLERRGELIKYRYLIVASTFTYTLSLFIPIAYRFLNYFLIFNYLAIILFVDKIVCRGYKLHPLLFLMCCSVYILFKARMYMLPYGSTNVASYHQYYPYASIFDKSIDHDREVILKESY